MSVESLSSGFASSSVDAVRRLAAEASKLAKGQNSFGITIDPDTITHWTANISGVQGSPYEEGLFVVDLIFPHEYPFAPPRVTFRTPIFHPNISTNGALCLDILKPSAWSPLISNESLLLSIQSLLDDPNPDDPLNVEAADIWCKNRKKFDTIAKEQTNKYATSNFNQHIPISQWNPPNSSTQFSHFQMTDSALPLDEQDALKLAVQNSLRNL